MAKANRRHRRLRDEEQGVAQVIEGLIALTLMVLALSWVTEVTQRDLPEPSRDDGLRELVRQAVVAYDGSGPGQIAVDLPDDLPGSPPYDHTICGATLKAALEQLVGPGVGLQLHAQINGETYQISGPSVTARDTVSVRYAFITSSGQECSVTTGTDIVVLRVVAWR